jgi:hypothetical protein
MRGLLLGGAATLTLLFGLACGGVWNEAMSQAVVEKVDEYAPKVAAVPDGPEKARVEGVLQAMKANKAQVGFTGIVAIEVELQAALADGEIDDGEASAIEAAYAEATQPGS